MNLGLSSRGVYFGFWPTVLFDTTVDSLLSPLGAWSANGQTPFCWLWWSTFVGLARSSATSTEESVTSVPEALRDARIVKLTDGEIFVHSLLDTAATGASIFGGLNGIAKVVVSGEGSILTVDCRRLAALASWDRLSHLRLSVYEDVCAQKINHSKILDTK